MTDVQDIAEVLGVVEKTRRKVSPLTLIRYIENGLPLAALERVCRLVAPGDAVFKYGIVPKASLQRRMIRKRLSGEESGRLARLAKVWSFAREVWGSDAEARDFLFRPHQLLDGRKPMDVVLGGEFGAQLVEAILGRLQHGSAV